MLQVVAEDGREKSEPSCLSPGRAWEVKFSAVDYLTSVVKLCMAASSEAGAENLSLGADCNVGVMSLGECLLSGVVTAGLGGGILTVPDF